MKYVLIDGDCNILELAAHEIVYLVNRDRSDKFTPYNLFDVIKNVNDCLSLTDYVCIEVKNER